jgi:hypothetical protein
MTQLAMFDAVNSIERKYQPYLVQLPATPSASKDAAAAAAAGTVLAGINPLTQATVNSLLESYLAAIPDSPAKAEGIKLGEAVAAQILAERANDAHRNRIPIGPGPPPAYTYLPLPQRHRSGRRSSLSP